MGYDCSISNANLTEAERERLREARAARREATLAVEALSGQGPSGETDTQKFLDAMAAGETYWQARIASHRVPPSDAWIEAHKALDAATAEEDAADVGYFRANISGMGLLRGLMDAANMLVPSDSLGAWPDHKGIDWDRIEQIGEGEIEGTPEEIAYLAAREAHLRAHGAGEPGIPVHKFGSNDGWIVTPEEIEAGFERAAGRAPEAANGHPENVRIFWRKWLDFLRLAADRGGFEVW